MTELEASGVGEHPPPYIIFVVVFLFFLTGLLGFLVCHLLKKKGYRCRTGDMDDDEEEEEKLGNADDEDEENQDTVEQILKCIIENEANMEAFNEMLGNHNVCVRHDPRLRKESIGGVPPHHHTVHSGTDHNSCHLCAQVRSKKGRRQSRTPRFKQRPGEQTVFSVGRFRVTHTDKKLQGGPNPLAISGDQLDQSQDSEERKEGGYNLRSMFKEVRQPLESASGVAPNVGKRRKSLTIFGLRRGSDPAGLKVGDGTGRETGGVKFAIQQQPVVLEEPVQTKNTDVDPATKPRSKPETKPASPQHEAKTSGSVNSLSSQSKKPVRDSSFGPEECIKPGPSTEPHTRIMIKPSTGSSVAFAPGSLPIPSEKRVNVEDKMLKTEEAYNPGPLQTSTPISPMTGSVPGFTSVVSTGQIEPCSTTGLSVSQTSSSPDQAKGFDASLQLLSLGSSPQSSFPVKTSSSVSSLLKTPTSPLGVTQSPKLSSRNVPSDTANAAFSPALSPSPKLLPGREMSSQSTISSSSFGEIVSPLQVPSPSPAVSANPKFDTMLVSPQTPSPSPADQKNPSLTSSPHLTLKAASVTSVPSMTKGDMDSSSLSLKEQKLDGATVPMTEGKTGIKRAGILKTAKLSPVAARESEGPALSSSSDQPFKDSLGSLPLSPCSPMSPSSLQGSRISSVTNVKASPDSKRVFSVVTMLDEEESSTSIKDQEGEAAVSGVGQPESFRPPEVRPLLNQEKDDMVEMEDIRDCKVMQVEGAEKVEEEEVEKMAQSKQD